MKNPAPSPFDLRLDLNRGVLRKTLSVLAPLFACATLSHATVLLQENFNSLTTGDLNGQNSWTADAGLDVVAGGQSYNSGTLSISGGANRAQSSTPSPGVTTPLATKSFASQSNEIWMSFTMSISTSVNGDRYWFWLSDTTSINSGFTAAIGDTNSGTKGLYAETRINTTAVASPQTSVTEGQIVFVVARLSKDGAATDANAYDRVELWVNPTSTIIGSATTSVDRTDSVFTGGVVSFGLTVLGATPTLGWDNLLVGTTQADVLNVYAIPEPSTYAALGGLGALAFASLRRRRA